MKPHTQTESSIKRHIVMIVVFSVLSALGGLVKIPSPLGSIACDSSPGYFCAAYFGPVMGAIVGAVGHIASAATSGFPLGVAHAFVALQMFAWCFLFGFTIRRVRGLPGLLLASVVAIILNGVGSPLLLSISPVNALPFVVAKGLILFLLVASALNVILAAVAYRAIIAIRVPGL